MMKTYLKLCMTALLPVTVLTACDDIRGSGRMVKEDRNVGTYTRVEVSGDMDVYITKGGGTSATIEAEDNIIPMVELIKEEGALKVRYRRNVSIGHHKEIKIYLTTETLEGVEMSGSGNIALKSHFTAANPVAITVSGSGNIKGSFTAPKVSMEVSGSGDIDIKGETREVKVEITGSGSCRAEDLLSETTEVQITGSGDAKVHASKELTTNIMGSGNVYYKGEPQIRSSRMGSGEVKKL